MIIVLDTNVLVSALYSPQGPPAQLLHLVAQGRLRLVHSPIILKEYQEVLARPRFAFDPKKVAQILSFIQLTGLTVSPKPCDRQLPDPTDLPFLSAALESPAKLLVTGNLKDFPAEICRPVKPLSPAAFMAAWK